MSFLWFNWRKPQSSSNEELTATKLFFVIPGRESFIPAHLVLGFIMLRKMTWGPKARVLAVVGLFFLSTIFFLGTTRATTRCTPFCVINTSGRLSVNPKPAQKPMYVFQCGCCWSIVVLVPTRIYHASLHAENERWVETLSWNPRIFLFHNMLTEEEASHIVDIGIAHPKKCAFLRLHSWSPRCTLNCGGRRWQTCRRQGQNKLRCICHGRMGKGTTFGCVPCTHSLPSYLASLGPYL